MSWHCDNDDGPYGVVAFKDGPLTFPKWMKRVDAFVDQITGKIGFTSEDFADWGFADAFEGGVEPRQAAIDMPVATDVRLYNLPGITAVPDMPAATVVRLDNLPKLPANTPAPKCAPRGQIYRNGRVWK